MFIESDSISSNNFSSSLTYKGWRERLRKDFGEECLEILNGFSSFNTFYHVQFEKKEPACT